MGVWRFSADVRPLFLKEEPSYYEQKNENYGWQYRGGIYFLCFYRCRGDLSDYTVVTDGGGRPVEYCKSVIRSDRIRLIYHNAACREEEA